MIPIRLYAMKRLSFIRYACLLFMVFIPLMARATGQIADDVIIDGEKWELLGSPLSYNDSIYNRVESLLPKHEDRSWSTANWSGFYGCWEIVDSCLYLKKIVVNMWNEHKKERYALEFDADTLRSVLGEYYTGHGIYARWYSREKLIIGRGELVTYVHGGYLRNHEEELVVTIENGRITHQEHWHNKKVMEGWSLSEGGLTKTGIQIRDSFPYDQFPEMGTKRIIVHVKNISLTSDGHFEDCDASFFKKYDNGEKELIEDPNHPIIVALKETMRKMYPWEVIYLHGKYTISSPNPGSGFTLPLVNRQQKTSEGE